MGKNVKKSIKNKHKIEKHEDEDENVEQFPEMSEAHLIIEKVIIFIIG